MKKMTEENIKHEVISIKQRYREKVGLQLKEQIIFYNRMINNWNKLNTINSKNPKQLKK